MTNGVDDKGPTLERVSSSTTRPMAWSVGYGAGSGRIACRYPSYYVTQVLNCLFTICTIQLLQLTWQPDYLLAAVPLLKRRVEVVAHHLGLRLR